MFAFSQMHILSFGSRDNQGVTKTHEVVVSVMVACGQKLSGIVFCFFHVGRELLYGTLKKESPVTSAITNSLTFRSS